MGPPNPGSRSCVRPHLAQHHFPGTPQLQSLGQWMDDETKIALRCPLDGEAPGQEWAEAEGGDWGCNKDLVRPGGLHAHTRTR